MKKKIIIILSVIFVLLVTALLLSVYVIVPDIVEKRRIEEEERIALEIENEKAQKEAERQELLLQDEMAFESYEYSGVFLSMTGSGGWSMDIPKAFVGIDVVKNNAVIQSEEEFMRLWSAALSSENEITHGIFIIDPARDIACVDEIVEDNPEMDFRIFTAMYPREHWQEYTPEEFDSILIKYREFIEGIIEYPNVVLSCYTGDEWIIDNPLLFADPETGSLVEEITGKLFLYTYLEGMAVNADSYEYALSRMNKNLRPEPKPVVEEVKESKWQIFKTFVFGEKEEPEEEEINYEYDLTDYDVIFMGDSIFALSDGSWSIPSVTGVETGAKVYNLSKGGINASEGLREAVDCFVNKRSSDLEGWDVYNRDIAAYIEADHTDRKTVFVFNCCINDYINGDTLEAYEKGLRECFEEIKKADPEAELVFMAPYYIQDRRNGTVLNEAGLRMADYVGVAKDLSEELGVYVLDLLATGEFNNYAAARDLDDGTHPSPIGCKAVADILSRYLYDVLEKE